LDVNIPGNLHNASNVSGSRASSLRNTLRHESMRSMGVPTKQLHALGIPDKLIGYRDALGILGETLVATARTIESDSHGLHILPNEFNPFAAAMIGPDHLISGHFLDIVGCAFLVLPKKARFFFEAWIRCKLEEAGLPYQNKIYNHKDAVLLTMTMSEAFSFMPVIQSAFAITCSHLTGNERNGMQEKVSTLLYNFVLLAGNIWFSDSEGPGTSSQGVLDRAFKKYVDSLTDLCAMSPDMVQRITTVTNEVIPVKKMTEADKRLYMCVRLLDKPNTHRLREYYVQHTQHWYSSVHTSELGLEKTHQVVKNAVRSVVGSDMGTICVIL